MAATNEEPMAPDKYSIVIAVFWSAAKTAKGKETQRQDKVRGAKKDQNTKKD